MTYEQHLAWELAHKDDDFSIRICPICGRRYEGEPCNSLEDGFPICRACKIRQVQKQLGFMPEESDNFIKMLMDRFGTLEVDM